LVDIRFTEKGHNEGYTEATARTDEIHRGFTLGVDMSAAIAAEVDLLKIYLLYIFYY